MNQALFRIIIGVLHAGLEGDGARRRIADGHGFGEDLLHPLVGREGLALFDADGGELSQHFRMIGFVRLVLDDVVHFLVEMEIIGMDGVVLLAGGR